MIEKNLVARFFFVYLLPQIQNIIMYEKVVEGRRIGRENRKARRNVQGPDGRERSAM